MQRSEGVPQADRSAGTGWRHDHVSDDALNHRLLGALDCASVAFGVSMADGGRVWRSVVVTGGVVRSDSSGAVSQPAAPFHPAAGLPGLSG